MGGALAAVGGSSALTPAPVWLSLAGLGLVAGAVALSLGFGGTRTRLARHLVPAPQRD